MSATPCAKQTEKIEVCDSVCKKKEKKLGECASVYKTNRSDFK